MGNNYRKTNSLFSKLKPIVNKTRATLYLNQENVILFLERDFLNKFLLVCNIIMI